MTTDQDLHDADVWRIRYEQAALEKADLETTCEGWQRCALDFAELLLAAGHPVGVIEPLVADNANANAHALIDAGIGLNYRESVQASVNHAREQVHRTADPASALNALINRLDNLTSASRAAGRKSSKETFKVIEHRRQKIHQVLMSHEPDGSGSSRQRSA